MSIDQPAVEIDPDEAVAIVRSLLQFNRYDNDHDDCLLCAVPRGRPHTDHCPFKRADDASISTVNDMLMGTNGDTVGPVLGWTEPVPYDKALRACAWVVAMCDPMQQKFPKLLARVMAT